MFKKPNAQMMCWVGGGGGHSLLETEVDGLFFRPMHPHCLASMSLYQVLEPPVIFPKQTSRLLGISVYGVNKAGLSVGLLAPARGRPRPTDALSSCPSDLRRAHLGVRAGCPHPPLVYSSRGLARVPQPRPHRRRAGRRDGACVAAARARLRAAVALSSSRRPTARAAPGVRARAGLLPAPFLPPEAVSA